MYHKFYRKIWKTFWSLAVETEIAVVNTSIAFHRDTDNQQRDLVSEFFSLQSLQIRYICN